MNSIRSDGGTSLRALSEVRFCGPCFLKRKAHAYGETGRQNNTRELKRTVSERKAATSPEDGWRQNGRKGKRDKQGCPSGSKTVFMAQCPKSRPMGVRASIVAKKRVTSVERRDAGKWKR